MQWQEVRELFPDQFVLLSILDFRKENGKKIITDMAPVRVIPEREANREFFNVGPQQLVYHTSNEECVIHLRTDPLVRMRRNL
ncbi:hypothetical protein HMSSN036_11800 [Paenibacillus macerans]|uniref:Uncharacterized protein n=1 Tax=Paenibacillus macerans TaxID=44252 RepID=A0A090ZDS4_PAEMA|nr:hypothetical protein [Paenibacillus macerans]KFN08375.1 hypothetical protein DJ90_1761 [Paenibacillus macerans]MBS5913999.1 hypothetical protein [Paenibacillus macerans]MCY7557577.1 hypothetical protein [Paenibacillus macerans]MDU5949278.1 hypothetical protein [Paenibacillus macerans]MEC0137516.1 hypothetical protein [Paenibacillus macerans]